MIIKNLLVLVLFASNILAAEEKAKPEAKSEYIKNCTKEKNVLSKCAWAENQCNEPMRSRPGWCQDKDFYDNCIKDGKKACEKEYKEYLDKYYKEYYKAHPEIPAWKRFFRL